MNTVYKILFEVKLLHEFYLTDRNGSNIFSIATQAGRLNFLKSRFDTNDENINGDVDFMVPIQAKAIFDNYDLKLLPTYAGFKVVISVIPQKLLDGTVVYEPKNTLPNDLGIPVLVVKKGNQLNNFTNSKLEKTLPTAYYFSNDTTVSGNRIPPFLTADVSAFDAAVSYEQGELVKFAANDYREFYKDDSDTVQWISLSGNAFANENDRLLLPLNFYYAFPQNSAVTQVNFTLSDSDGLEVDKFDFKNDKALNKVRLTIDKKKVKVLPVVIANEKSIYTLTVTGNSGYNKTHRVVFYQDEKEIRDSLGLVLMKVKTSATAYNLLDNTGKLIAKKQSDGTYNPAPPVFEVNFKSKPSFWRYINNARKNLKSGLHTDLLLLKNGTLISKVPKALTYTSTLFRKPDNTLYYLPNPEPYQPVTFEKDKMYSDIMVQESALFPLAP
jgi:hypothetical protein